MPISFKVLSGEMKINRKMAEDMKGETEISEYNPVSLARAYGVRKREYGFWEKIKNLFIKLRESYDQRCADMLDLIFENVVYDVVYLGNIGGMQSDVYSMVGRYGFNCFDRLYQKKVSAIELELERIVNEYKS